MQRRQTLATALALGLLAPAIAARAERIERPNASARTERAEAARRQALEALMIEAQPLAQGIALALADSELRGEVRDAMRDSRWHEHKLVLQDFVKTPAGERLAAAVATALGEAPEAIAARLAALPRLDFYLPFQDHRTTWRGTPEVLVAAAFVEDAPAIAAYDVTGSPLTLRAEDGVPTSPLIVLHPAEPKRPRRDAAARGELVQEPSGLSEPGLERSSAASTTPGYYLYHYNIQAGDGWGGALEIQFRTYYRTSAINWVPYQFRSVGVIATEDQGYDYLLFLNDLPAPSTPSTAFFTLEIWEMDGGLNGSADDYGTGFYPPTPLNQIVSYYKATTFGSERSAYIGMTRREATGAATGSPFQYSSASDQRLSCYGIAGGGSSNCNSVADFHDRQMCSAMAQASQSPCTSMTDRNLQLSCYGMSIRWDSNCRDVTDFNMKLFCYGVSGRDVNDCQSVTDPGSRQLCLAMATSNSSYCGSIGNINDRQFCYGVATRDTANCATIQ